MAKKILCEGKFLRLIDEKSWEYVERHNCTSIVAVVALTRDKKILLVEQHRVPVGKGVIELPAGLVNDAAAKKKESVLNAAKRELLEETGYRAGKWKLITSGPLNAGLCAEELFFYRAMDLKKVSAGGGDPTESIRVHEIPFKGAGRWLRKMAENGTWVDPKVYAALYFLL